MFPKNGMEPVSNGHVFWGHDESGGSTRHPDLIWGIRRNKTVYNSKMTNIGGSVSRIAQGGTKRN